MSFPTLQRAYSTKVSAPPVEELKLTKLANGVTVATQETFSPLATIAVTVNAGARHETAATLGAAAYLKATAFQVGDLSFAHSPRMNTNPTKLLPCPFCCALLSQ